MSLGVEVLALLKLIGVGMVDEAFYLLTVSLLILILVFVVDLGLEVKEYILSIPTPLAAMALRTVRGFAAR